jgi:protein disulfide-isomerase A6
LDKLAIQFIKDKSTREKIHQEAVAAAKEIGTRYANYYAKLMEKILGQGELFIETEKARLTKMLKNDDISSAKLDDFNIRQNILNIFDKDAKPVDQ